MRIFRTLLLAGLAACSNGDGGPNPESQDAGRTADAAAARLEAGADARPTDSGDAGASDSGPDPDGGDADGGTEGPAYVAVRITDSTESSGVAYLEPGAPLDGLGRVAFRHRPEDAIGIWAGDGEGSPQALVEAGSAAAPEYDNFLEPALSESGRLAARASAAGLDSVVSVDEAGELTLVATREGGVPLGDFVNVNEGPEVTDSGQVLFCASRLGQYDCFRGDGSEAPLALVPDEYGILGDPRVRESGEVVMAARREADGQSLLIQVGDGETAEELVSNEELAPLSLSRVFDVAANGRYAFGVLTNGTSAAADGIRGGVIGEPGIETLVPPDPANRRIAYIAINSSGTVIYATSDLQRRDVEIVRAPSEPILKIGDALFGSTVRDLAPGDLNEAGSYSFGYCLENGVCGLGRLDPAGR